MINFLNDKNFFFMKVDGNIQTCLENNLFHNIQNITFSLNPSCTVHRLKVKPGQIGSAWEWSHCKGLKKSISFWFWILEKFSKFWAASYKVVVVRFFISIFIPNASNPPSYSAHRSHVHKPRSFPLNSAPKMPKSQQLFFGLQLVSRIFKTEI